MDSMEHTIKSSQENFRCTEFFSNCLSQYNGFNEVKYDYKTGIIQSDRLDKSKPLKGDFELKVRDNAGNEKTYTQKIF